MCEASSFPDIAYLIFTIFDAGDGINMLKIWGLNHCFHILRKSHGTPESEGSCNLFGRQVHIYEVTVSNGPAVTGPNDTIPCCITYIQNEDKRSLHLRKSISKPSGKIVHPNCQCFYQCVHMKLQWFGTRVTAVKKMAKPLQKAKCVLFFNETECMQRV
jgi:hypothetical protein